MGTQMRHKSREGRLENKRQCLFKAGEREGEAELGAEMEVDGVSCSTYCHENKGWYEPFYPHHSIVIIQSHQFQSELAQS